MNEATASEETRFPGISPSGIDSRSRDDMGNNRFVNPRHRSEELLRPAAAGASIFLLESRGRLARSRDRYH